ncbi:MAG TPA: VIT family protein [Usitatibacter sp.]|nr:VIT family protein [Usitatibacter sp.]
MEDSGWLRAAVLGANDGIVSTASLLVGVAASNADHRALIVAGVAGVVAGAMSMATGEYVSVHTQSDLEAAALARERRELRTDARGELEELAGIYEKRGLDRGLAKEVARQLTEHDALAAHARDELGMSKSTKARPLQAAFASALSFAAGGALPLLVVALSPHEHAARIVSAAALVALAGLGALSARQSGAPMARAVARVTFWSALALAVTAGVGALFGVSG